MLFETANDRVFEWIAADTPIIAAAIHDGHSVRAELEPLFRLTADERLREEDPFTGEMAAACGARMIGCRSRFEFDLNRPRAQAVYLQPADAWGLDIWKTPLDAAMIEQSLAMYDHFYAALEVLLKQLVQRHGHVVLLDIHSYNHRRDGATYAAADPLLNPEVNIGTGTMERSRWRDIVDGCIHDLRRYDYLGRTLDVRENVKFLGGNLSRWVHEKFPTTVCSISIEFKKFFMDEWTGVPDRRQIAELTQALRTTLPGIHECLRGRGSTSSDRAALESAL